MAALAASYVTILKSWTFGGTSGKERVARQVQITVPATDSTAYGDGTNTIPAAVLKLQKIEESSPFVDSTQKMIPAAPKTDGSILQTYNLNQATDASRSGVSAQIARIDGSNAGVFVGIVKGYA